MSKKYRKKPVVIEAWHFGYEALPKEANIQHRNRSDDWICNKCGRDWHSHVFVPTLEGERIMCHEDYLIKGVLGEFYPCKPEAFAKTYEEVKE